MLDNYLPKQPITWIHGVRCGPDPQAAYAGDATLKGGGWYCFEAPVIQAGDAWLWAKGQPYQMKNLTGLSQEELEQYLSQQVPLVVWATLQCQTPHLSSYPWTLPDGTKYYPYINLHCIVHRLHQREILRGGSHLRLAGPASRHLLGGIRCHGAAGGDPFPPAGQRHNSIKRISVRVFSPALIFLRKMTG